MTGYFTAAPRALLPQDAEAVRALVWGSLGVTPYLDRVVEQLRAAERGDQDCRALLIERDGIVAALTLFGPVAGSRGAWHISMMLLAPRIETREIGRALLDGVADEARQDGGRLLIAELPADAVLGRSLSLLRASGFREEGRVPDFYRDGVSLLFLRREL